MFEGTVNVTVTSLEYFIRELMKLNIASNRIYLFPGHEYSMVNFNIKTNAIFQIHDVFI